MSRLSAPERALTYSDYVFDNLRSDIVCGSFAPGEKLAMKTLSSRYRVGLSPIREALHRLVGEGFVHSIGQRGFTVPPLSIEDLADLTALRSLVEEAAIRQAIVRGDDAWEAGIVGAFHRLARQVDRLGSTSDAAMQQYDKVHRSFHVAIFAGVTSARLATLQATLFDQAFRYRKSLHGPSLSPDHVIAEHRQLMESVLTRDPERAVAAICGHLHLTKDYLASAFEATPRVRDKG